jgi:DNA helicase-2/ATP-dependent DNA helicase PcrA
MAELNEPQARAVAHPGGPLLIFAGAGSGKTRTITYRIANLLAVHRVPPYRILAVTFTNKAAGEMRHRLEQLAGAEVARDLWVGTFHSVCARLLRRYASEVGLSERFVIYDESDQKAVVTRLLKELELDERRYPPRYLLSRFAAEKREGRGPDIAEFDDATLAQLFARYQGALRASNAVDFEDLIFYVLGLAESETGAGRELRARFQHVLVDEFQDTNLSQYRLVRAFAAAHRNLCVVGDDDQSIYRWRGADVRLIRGFRHDFPEVVVVKLEQNYRSTANIVAAALGVIEPAAEREPKRLWTDAPRGEPIVVRAVRDERAEAAAVVRGIRREMERGVLASSIAVFYRVHAQSRVLEEALRAENVLYQVVGGMRFFERAEVKDVLAYLRLVDNPKSDADLLRVINTPPRGIGQKTVARLLETAQEDTLSAYEALAATLSGDALGSAARKKLAAFHELLEELFRAAPELGPRELAERVLERTNYRRALEEQDSAEADARLENIAELLGSLEEYAADAHEAGEPATLSGYLERVSLVAAVDNMVDKAVSLMTVHSAKGLEFDAVFLTGMEEEIFPYRGLDSEHPEELDEERRLAYVAVTRARKRLHVTHAAVRSLFGTTRYLTPSRFLEGIPPEVVRHEGETSFGVTRGIPPPRQLRAVPVRHPGERFVDHDAFDDTADEAQALSPGATVVHRRFGRGVVERVEWSASPSVLARFPGHGTKRILAEYLELDDV